MSEYQFMGELFGAARRTCAVPADAPAKDVCRNRSRGNPNSESAFQSIKDRLTVQQERVLRTIKASDNGLTCDEIAVILGGNPNEVSGRCSELFRDGKIKKVGKRLTRRGNPASVLMIA